MLPRLKPRKHQDKVGKTPCKKVVRLEMSESYSGPLPDARSFEKYEIISPGAANRILSMAEKEQDLRQSLARDAAANELKELHANIKLKWHAQWSASLVAILMVCLSFYVVWSGSPGWGASIAISGIAASVSAFLKGKQKDDDPTKQDQQNKN